MDYLRSTHPNFSKDFIPPLNSYLEGLSLTKIELRNGNLLAVTNHYLDHGFDLLGSGWVQVRHNPNMNSLNGHQPNPKPILIDPEGNWLKKEINRFNLEKSRFPWSLLGLEYTPIDWHMDFKSGYRWCPRTWSKKLSYGEISGIDVKVPWELSRMQHLPQLALASFFSRNLVQGFNSPETYSEEFQNQILDFISTNPPRFGINWRCPMDVGIRAANWLLAFDLFQTQGTRFPTEFEKIFHQSIYAHGQHIINNLEWNSTLRHNHYLANITSLVFIAAYLPGNDETNTWLALAIQELIYEMESQFQADGSNFEGSTSYHRLSGEMMVYATALVLGLPESRLEALKNYNPRFTGLGPKLNPPPLPFYSLNGSGRMTPLPPWFLERLESIAEFTQSITKPNGRVPQIGDNDNGRFFKIAPKYREMTTREARQTYHHLKNHKGLSDDAPYLQEDILDHSHLVAAIRALFGKSVDSEDHDLEREIILSLAGHRTLKSSAPPAQIGPSEMVRIGNQEIWDKWTHTLFRYPETQRHLYTFSVEDKALRSQLRLSAFPNFGLYIFRSSSLYLAIRCGSVGQDGKGGHAHNDQLSIELTLDGQDLIRDPGTYLYTPHPEKRNQYRSVKAHFCPQVEGKETNPIDENLFFMEDRSKPDCLYFGEKGFIGTHQGLGAPVYRIIQINENALIIEDFVDGPLALTKLDPNKFPQHIPFSPGYGMLTD